MSSAAAVSVHLSADTKALDQGLADARARTEPTPVYDEVIAEFGPLCEPVDTDYVLLESQAVLALAERQTC